MNSDVFDRLADRYDAWFDSPRGAAIFQAEVGCVRTLMPADTSGWVEVGVGSGRFADALGVSEGVDPSPTMLSNAADRGIRTVRARAEQLPYPDDCLGGILFVVTLCFVDEPEDCFEEFARTLKPGAALTVGIVPADSHWGRNYREKAEEGHPFYSVARFYTCSEAAELAASAGFRMVEAASALPPGSEAGLPSAEVAAGLKPGWGFAAMRFGLESEG